MRGSRSVQEGEAIPREFPLPSDSTLGLRTSPTEAQPILAVVTTYNYEVISKSIVSYDATPLRFSATILLLLLALRLEAACITSTNYKRRLCTET